MPSKTSILYQFKQQKMLVKAFPNRGLSLVKGEGVRLYDDEGTAYLDLASNFGVSNFGHSNPDITGRIHQQIDTLLSLHGSFASDIRVEATEKLLKTIKLPFLNKAFWSSSGAEAIEAAIKFAMLTTGKNHFLVPQGSYHGKSLGALSLTTSGDSKYQKPFQESLLPHSSFECNNFQDLQDQVTAETAAVVLELVQGENGAVPIDEEFLQHVSTFCKEQDILLIIDEIQTGVCRTGQFLALHDYPGIKCDILCLGKGLAGGVPVGATVVSDQISAQVKPGLHSLTFSGNPLCMAGVASTLEYVTNHPELPTQIQEISSWLLTQLNTLKEQYPDQISSISGKGFLIGIETTKDPSTYVKQLQRNYIIVAPTSTNKFRVLPPVVITRDELKEFLQVFESILEQEQ